MPKVKMNGVEYLVRWPEEIKKKIMVVAKKYTVNGRVMWKQAKESGELMFLPLKYQGWMYLSKYYNSMVRDVKKLIRVSCRDKGRQQKEKLVYSKIRRKRKIDRLGYIERIRYSKELENMRIYSRKYRKKNKVVSVKSDVYKRRVADVRDKLNEKLWKMVWWNNLNEVLCLERV